MGSLKRDRSCNWNRWQQIWNTYVTYVWYNKHISTIFNHQFAFFAHSDRNIPKAICIHDPSETLQSSSSLTVVHYVIGAVSGLFQRKDERHAASLESSLLALWRKHVLSIPILLCLEYFAVGFSVMEELKWLLYSASTSSLRSWHLPHSEHWSTKSSARLDAGGRTLPNKSTTTLLFCLAKHLYLSIYIYIHFINFAYLCFFTLSIPLSYFDYFGHVHPSLSFKGLAPHPWAVWPPPVWDSANAKQLPGESAWVPWFSWTQHRCKLYQIVLYVHMLYILGKQLSANNNWLHKSQRRLQEAWWVHKFHEINKINVIIVCQYVTSNTLNFHQMECVPKCQTAHSCAQPCAHQTTQFW